MAVALSIRTAIAVIALALAGLADRALARLAILALAVGGLTSRRLTGLTAVRVREAVAVA